MCQPGKHVARQWPECKRRASRGNACGAPGGGTEVARLAGAPRWRVWREHRSGSGASGATATSGQGLSLKVGVAAFGSRNPAPCQRVCPGLWQQGQPGARVGQHATQVTRLFIAPAQRGAGAGAAARQQHAQRAGLVGAAQPAAIAGLAGGWLAWRGGLDREGAAWRHGHSVDSLRQSCQRISGVTTAQFGRGHRGLGCKVQDIEFRSFPSPCWSSFPGSKADR